MAPWPVLEETQFPRAGARARRIGRFEDDLQRWLKTPHGQFALWRAEQAVARQPAPAELPGR